VGRVAVAVLSTAGEHRPTRQLDDRPQLGGLGARLHPLQGGDLVDQVVFDRHRLVQLFDRRSRIRGRGSRRVGHAGQPRQLHRVIGRLHSARPAGQYRERHPHHRPANGRHPIHHRSEHVFESTGKVRHW
jgi:hypothetical protein